MLSSKAAFATAVSLQDDAANPEHSIFQGAACRKLKTAWGSKASTELKLGDLVASYCFSAQLKLPVIYHVPWTLRISLTLTMLIFKKKNKSGAKPNPLERMREL